MSVDFHLVGIEGVRRKRTPVKLVSSVGAMIRHPSREQATTAAGSAGALNAYVDDKGFYRGELYQFQITKDKILAVTKVELRRWLARNWAAIGDPSKAASRA